MAAGLCAGILGATLGIGGGPILIPIWLSAGVDKEVASSSTATLILTSSTIAFTISAFNGTYDSIPLYKIFIYMLLAFISSAVIKCTFWNIQKFWHISLWNMNSNLWFFTCCFLLLYFHFVCFSHSKSGTWSLMLRALWLLAVFVDFIYFYSP